MGKIATRIQRELAELLKREYQETDWRVEQEVAGTPVDIHGETDQHSIIIELEWRRADPADNTAKLFRHLEEGSLGSSNILVLQLFTEYYDLSRGGVSSKRRNAEFIGQKAAEASDRFEYSAVDFPLDPPKGDTELQDGWQSSVQVVADSVSSTVEEHL